jgi:hypothetical protein
MNEEAGSLLQLFIQERDIAEAEARAEAEREAAAKAAAEAQLQREQALARALAAEARALRFKSEGKLALTEAEAAEFDKLTDKTASSVGCHLWLGAKVRSYATFTILGKQVPARQIAYFRYHKRAPRGHLINLCYNNLCVNPEHIVHKKG